MASTRTRASTWASPVTPMTDFPVMNANLHAMSLLGLVRVCGIEASVEGLLIRPCVPRKQFVLDTPLISLDLRAGRLRGVYHACVDGSRRLTIEKPAGTVWISARSGERSLSDFDPQAAQIALDIQFTAGDDLLFEVVWAASS